MNSFSKEFGKTGFRAITSRSRTKLRSGLTGPLEFTLDHPVSPSTLPDQLAYIRTQLKENAVNLSETQIDDAIETLRAGKPFRTLVNINEETVEHVLDTLVSDATNQPVTVVRGTSPIRKMVDYKNNVTTEDSYEGGLGDVHHILPLYLGGGHETGNLFAFEKVGLETNYITTSMIS